MKKMRKIIFPGDKMWYKEDKEDEGIYSRLKDTLREAYKNLT